MFQVIFRLLWLLLKLKYELKFTTISFFKSFNIFLKLLVIKAKNKNKVLNYNKRSLYEIYFSTKL